jgi:hypothetical protein
MQKWSVCEPDGCLMCKCSGHIFDGFDQVMFHDQVTAFQSTLTVIIIVLVVVAIVGRMDVNVFFTVITMHS